MKFTLPLNRTKKQGFTLAEVLITLVIIGIIAAITVPTIMANSRKIEVETRLKQTYSILNNALTRAVADNGPLYTWDEMEIDTDPDKLITFFKTYIEPYIIFAKPIEKTTYQEYGYKKEKAKIFQSTDKEWLATLNNGSIILELQHGVAYQRSDEDTTRLGNASITITVDVNGIKKPNQIGRDIFMFDLMFIEKNPKFNLYNYKKQPDRMPHSEVGKHWIVEMSTTPKSELMENCKTSAVNCGALIQQNGWKIPKDYPINI